MARLAFFGTPDFAVETLRALHAFAQKDGHELVRVICQPDRPKGRGKKMQPPPVKAWALEHGLKVDQPGTLKKGTPSGDEFRAELASLDLDLAVVAAYGRILPRGVLRMAKRGFVNVHGSLLPRWRGAAPIERAIEAGDEKTGVCIMDMVFELDAGDVYLERAIVIRDDDDAPKLRARLASLGGEALVEALPGILQGHLNKRPQPDAGLTYAEMLKKEEAVLDWHLPARALFNRIRAFVPWPGAQTQHRDQVLKLFDPLPPAQNDVDKKPSSGTPGEIVAIDDHLWVQTGKGVLGFGGAQLPGKKRLSIAQLMNGRTFAVGEKLGA